MPSDTLDKHRSDPFHIRESDHTRKESAIQFRILERVLAAPHAGLKFIYGERCAGLKLVLIRGSY